ncbi:DUF2155 domain-containing protein [Amaricoccus macauensis]|uniref:DUF2155 domain-containing protein n=1 Tax=Amaricoccus macauensis TaxID=57001 RepID=UPI003C7AB7BB
MIARPLVLVAALLVGASTAASQSVVVAGPEQTVEAPNVHLRGLDTVNGAAQDIELRAGETVRFGHLEVSVDTCRVPRGDTTGDAFAFVRIRDIRETEARFSGWMFASSPALSALDHPRYDVWVESCSSS